MRTLKNYKKNANGNPMLMKMDTTILIWFFNQIRREMTIHIRGNFEYVLGLYSLQCDMAIVLTHWGRETHICVDKLTIIASDNGLSPGRRQAIIWTNARMLLIGPLGTNFNEILIEIHTFPFNKMHLKMPSAKWRPFCLGPNVLTWARRRLAPRSFLPYF